MMTPLHCIIIYGIIMMSLAATLENIPWSSNWNRVWISVVVLVMVQIIVTALFQFHTLEFKGD